MSETINHIVGISGGKDSVCMALLLRERTAPGAMPNEKGSGKTYVSTIPIFSLMPNDRKWKPGIRSGGANR